MITVWRLLLIISLALIGLSAGTWVGGHFLVPEGSGLAGAPMALGYGLLGAIVLLVVGFVAAFRLRGSSLSNVALISAIVATLVYGALTYRWMLNAAASREPDTAFAVAGEFNATMERLDISDPYLFVKMEVDSRNRQWTQTGPAPDHAICSAKINAKTLTGMRVALDNLAAMSETDFTACRAPPGPAIKRLSWDLKDAQIPQDLPGFAPKGRLDISAACAQNHEVVARALALIENASTTATSKVKCK